MKEKLDPTVPGHVGIIMDGNGRWAAKRKMPRNFGHKAGADRIEEVATELFEKGVANVSLYALSTENMQRPKEEIGKLFDIMRGGIKKCGAICRKNGIRLVISGDASVLPADLAKTTADECASTAGFPDSILNICINYGGQQELCRAFEILLSSGEEITAENVSRHLYNGMPPLDLVIRSGGEHRLSNFMLWQASYAELYFTDVLWPDFTKEETDKALAWFSERRRRFGKI